MDSDDQGAPISVIGYDCCLVACLGVVKDPPPCWHCGRMTGVVLIMTDGKHPAYSTLRLSGWL